MEHIFTTAAIWLGLAVLSTIIAYHLKISIALIEICIGVAAAAVANHFFGQILLEVIWNGCVSWLRQAQFCLHFLAGAELDPKVISSKKKEVSIVGLVGFLAPFLGCAAITQVYFTLEHAGKFACRGCAFHNIYGCGLCGHA